MLESRGTIRAAVPVSLLRIRKAQRGPPDFRQYNSGKADELEIYCSEVTLHSYYSEQSGLAGDSNTLSNLRPAFFMAIVVQSRSPPAQNPYQRLLSRELTFVPKPVFHFKIGFRPASQIKFVGSISDFLIRRGDRKHSWRAVAQQRLIKLNRLNLGAGIAGDEAARFRREDHLVCGTAIHKTCIAESRGGPVKSTFFGPVACDHDDLAALMSPALRHG